MLLSEQRAMPPLIAQRDLRLHAKVQVLKRQVYQVLALALPLLVQVLLELVQLRERLVEFELVQRVPVLKQPGLKQPVLVRQVPQRQELLVQQAQLCELN
jgi:hypothetical protein